MKTITKISKLFILAMIVFAFNQNAKAWTRITIGSSSWTIEFPGTPTGPSTTGSWTTVYVHSASGHPTFELRYQSLATPMGRPAMINNALDADLRDYAREIGGTVSRVVAPHDWKNGRSMIGDVENPNNMKAKVRTFIYKGKEKFVLIVHNQNTYPPVAGVDRFWNSLTQ